MKNKEKVGFLYSSIKILGILTIIVLIGLSLSSILLWIEDSGIAKALGMYDLFYSIIEMVLFVYFMLFFVVFIVKIPYIISSIILGIITLKKYIENKENMVNILKKGIAFGVIAFLLIYGFSLFPGTGRYEYNINSKVCEIKDERLKALLKQNFFDDMYIFKVKIIQDFPNGYHEKIYYFDDIIKVEEELNQEQFDYIFYNAIDITNRVMLQSIIISNIGLVLYILGYKYILKDIKRIL